VATQDKAVPPRAEEFMAKRAGARICHVRSAHDVPVFHPREVTELIEIAAS
jgi:hypothetical protein